MSQTFTPVEGVDKPHFKTVVDAKCNLKRIAIFAADGCDQRLDYGHIVDAKDTVIRTVNLNDNTQFTTFSGEKYQICQLDFEFMIPRNEVPKKVKLCVMFAALVVLFMIAIGVYTHGKPIGVVAACSWIVLPPAYSLWDHIKTKKARRIARKAIIGRTTDWRAKAILKRFI